MKSVQRQISFLALFTSTVTLVLAAAAFSAYEYTNLRQSLHQRVATLASAVASNAVGPLSFADPDAALATLETLSTNSIIKHASLEDTLGIPLANYGDELQSRPHFNDASRQEVTQGDYYWLKSPVYYRGGLLGHLYLAASTEELLKHLIRFFWIAAIILCFCVLLALGLSRRLPQAIMNSLNDMTGVFDRISKTQDYSERAVVTPYKEFNILTDSLNHMLEALSQKDSELQYWANYDDLTKLPNRHMFLSTLNHAVELAKRQKLSLAVFFIDLDHFKRVNDALGHEAGDELLQACARRMSGCLRASDTLARLGGDEFVLLAESSSTSAALAQLADKLINVLLEPINIAEHEISITASIGIAIFPETGEEPSTLLKNADTAMYRSKRKGRNCFAFYEPTMDSLVGSRLDMEIQLRNALNLGEFYVEYQPKLNYTTNRFDSVEALLRWNNPALGIIGPNIFIPLAEELGLIRSIGQWVLQQSCEQLAIWQADNVPVSSVAVNISSIQFEDEAFIEKLDAVLADTGINGCGLELELTESVLMNTNERVIQKLNQIHQRGIKISIDDFGTGYSSLQYLSLFPIDCLKIDRSFIHGMEHDTKSLTIVKAILAMGKGLEVTVVAEGVEEPGQQDLLRMLGCDFGQGYLYSKPLRPENLRDILMRTYA